MKRTALAAIVLTTAVAAGCGDGTTNPLAGKGQTVGLSFAGVKPAGLGGVMAVRNALADTLVVTDGTNTLRITSAEVVVREIELKRVQTTIDCDTVTDEDACEEFTIGAVLVSLPLASGVDTRLEVPVDSGTYSEVEFEIHKPGSDSVDQAFTAQNPTWPTNISIRVQGTFNGTPFTFTSDLNEDQEFTFSPPLVIDASGATTNLTIRLDVSTWFRNGAAGPLVDPATANKGGANENLVKDNIKASIKAFEDEDQDGDERDG
ncbi:MAG: hypothetical protein HYR48_04190 [Gemmatimonadetes bacterium]|nr:hypothetical protein [Gemmatimonadota bacterium]